MTITTRQITGPVVLPDGTGVATGVLVATLSGRDHEDLNLIVPAKVSYAIADGALPDEAVLWVNAEGDAGTSYSVRVEAGASGRPRTVYPSFTAVVPPGTGAISLAECMLQDTPPSLSDAEIAVIESRDARDAAAGSASSAAASATAADASATAAAGSAAAAAGSATAAGNSATAAAASESAAAGSAISAGNSATAAGISAIEAAASEAAAGASASAAAGSETAAGNSADLAGTAKTGAEAARDLAATYAAGAAGLRGEITNGGAGIGTGSYPLEEACQVAASFGRTVLKINGGGDDGTALVQFAVDGALVGDPIAIDAAGTAVLSEAEIATTLEGTLGLMVQGITGTVTGLWWQIDNGALP